MGAGAGKPSLEKLVYRNPKDGARFIGNENDTVLLLQLSNQRSKERWKRNCVFSEDPVFLTNGREITLNIEGSGILKFGITREDPNGTNDFIKETIAIHEDGFNKEKGTRIVSVDAFNFVTYENRQKKTKKDLAELTSDTKAWLYVLVIHGSLKVSLQIDKSILKLKTFSNSNIKLSNMDATAISSRTSDSGVCILEEPVTMDRTYCINWQMKLGEDKNNPCSSKRFGFFRLGLVTQPPKEARDRLEQLSLYSAHRDREGTWFVESAISTDKFSEMITITINRRAQSITHNLCVSSASETVTEKIPLDFNGQLYLALEVFHGEINGIQKYQPRHAPRPAFPGHILLLKNFKQDSMLPDHILIGTHFKTEPCRIQYGTNPTMILAEFRQRFANLGTRFSTQDKPLPWDSLHVVQETSNIQLLDVPDDVTDHELENFFSNASACGGGEIKDMYRIEYIPGCWIIEYLVATDARTVWQEGKHRIKDSVMVEVLPFYKELGPAPNKGLKPQFDTTDLDIEIKDDKKMRFLLDVDKKHFEEYLMQNLNLQVVWPEVQQESEFEEDYMSTTDENDDNHIMLKCKIPHDQYQQLISWKEDGRKGVTNYLSQIQVRQVVVDKTVWNMAISTLEKEKKTKLFDFTVKKENNTIEIIASSEKLLLELKEKIENIPSAEAKIEKSTNIDISKYKFLDNIGLLNKLESDNPNTSSTLDMKNNKLILKGPKSEVDKMMSSILELIVDTEKVSVRLSKDKIRVLESEEGKKIFADLLMQHNTTELFEIKDSHCEIYVCLQSSDQQDAHKARNKLKTCLDSLIVEKKYTIPDELIEEARKEVDLKSELRKIEEGSKHTISMSVTGKVITCTGVQVAVEKAIEQIKFYFLKNTSDKGFIYFQRNIVNYIHAYREKFDTENFILIKNKDGELTGDVCFPCKAGEIDLTRKQIKEQTEKISTFWFYLKRPWLANAIENIQALKSLAEDNDCLMQQEIADTLADIGVSLVAVSTTGTVVQIINCDITTQDTDVIVNAANSELLMKGGIAKAISEAAGPLVQNECERYIEEHGKLAEGDAVFTNAGNLGCQEILHVVGPQWKGGSGKEKDLLQTAVFNILTMVSERKYLSVMIPAISCGVFGYPNDRATYDIVEAIEKYLLHNPGSSVKEICLCDNKDELIKHFETAVQKLMKPPWFVFKHNRTVKPVRVEKVDKKVASEEASSSLTRPKSGRPGQRTAIDGKLSRWGRGTKNTNQYSVEDSYLTDSSLSEEESCSSDNENRAMDHNIDIPDELPMEISLTNMTTLRIYQGMIEKQQHEAIVCTTPRFPDLAGAVAMALTRSGGDSIIKECETKGSLEFGDVRCTSGGQLSCKQLFHVRTLMNWSDEKGPENVQLIVESCLKAADAKGYRSLAFPAIGTGQSHYPADEVAKLMVKQILEYVDSNQNTGLQEIGIVIYQMDSTTAQTFENIIPRILASNVPQRLKKSTAVKSVEGTKKKQKHTVEKQKESKTDASPQTPRIRGPRVAYQEPSKLEELGEADDVVLVQVTTIGTTLEQIKEKAENLLDQEFLTKKINFKELTDEKILESDEVTRLHQLNTMKVKVNIDQEASKVIVSGLCGDVNRVANDASNLLKSDFPQIRKQRRTEQLVAEYIQWQVSDGGQGRVSVSTEVNFELEMNFDKGVDFTYMNNGTEYQVIRSTLEEHPKSQPYQKRKLYRGIRASQGTGICIPDFWSINDTGEDYKEVEILQNDPMFSNIKKKLTDAGLKPNSVDKIIRIENRALYLQYAIMKRKIEIRNGRRIESERELWHGSKSETFKLICEKGYDRGFAGRNAVVYGEGVYFAVSSQYSDRYALKDTQGTCRMMLTNVLTGEYHLGKQGMTAPPVKHDQVLYDSLVDNVNNPAIFVIFHDAQAYPQYLIEYQN